jgi:GT2 family glycosyltransferase
MLTPKKIVKHSKTISGKIKDRTFKDFYRGHSLPKVILKSGKFVIRRGPVTSYRILRSKLVSDGNLQFPNGLVSDVDIERIKTWYHHHGKPVAIVIPSYNDKELITNCLNSIMETVKKNRYRVIIVDDYCQESNRKELAKLKSSRVEILYREKNGGFAKAVNTGFKYARQKYPNLDIVLLNSDTVAHPNWLDSLQHGAYEFDKKVGIVGPKLLYPDGRIQSGGSHRNTEQPEWFDHYYRFKPSDYGPANVPQYCIGVTGACMYIKASTFRKLGILDEGFQFAFEDMDYCIRGWDKGIRTLYYPASTLTHVESASRPKNKSLKPKEKASVRHFWEKWGDWFDNRNIRDKEGKIRIIYVLQTTGISGGIRVVFEHLNRLQAKGFSTELWALDKHPTWTDLNTPSRRFKNYQQMIKALEKEEAIKVATWWETALPVWLSSVKNGIPAFVVQEIESSFYPGEPEIQKTVVSCYRKEFNNITSAEYTLGEIRDLGLDATLIPCGYDSTIYKPIKGANRDQNTLIALGRTFFQKNFKQTFEAWKSINKKQPHLLLFGSEPQIAKWAKGIEYITKPSDKDANKLYNRATVFVQTSYHEGFCLPILEAMAAGCPVICTDSHGNRGFSNDGKNCIMVETDNTEQLAKAIKKVIGDKHLQKKLSKAGLETAKGYTWDAITVKLEKYYKELAEQNNKKHIQKVSRYYK